MSKPEQQGEVAEQSQAAAGERFRQARESAGLTRLDAASRLNLSESYIEYIEEQRFDLLPSATFARGYIRSYAKSLGLPDDEMIACYEAYTAEQVSPTRSLIRINRQVKPSDPMVRGATYAILISVLALSMLWWQSQQDAPDANGLPLIEQEITSDAEVENTLSAEPPPVPGPAGDQAGVMTQPQSEVARPAVEERDTPSPGAFRDELVASNIDVTDPVDSSVGTEPPLNKLEVIFGEKSWIEVKDSEGKVLFTGVKRAGATLQLESDESFDIVIGNAAGVNLSYNGAAVDLAAHTNNRNVAKLKLETP